MLGGMSTRRFGLARASCELISATGVSTREQLMNFDVCSGSVKGVMFHSHRGCSRIKPRLSFGAACSCSRTGCARFRLPQKCGTLPELRRTRRIATRPAERRWLQGSFKPLGFMPWTVGWPDKSGIHRLPYSMLGCIRHTRISCMQLFFRWLSLGKQVLAYEWC